MKSHNDSALAHLHELLPISDFARRFPTVYASHDPVALLDDHHVVYVDVRPAAWPVEEPQHVITSAQLDRPGVVVGLLEGGMAIVGYPKAVYSHLRDEATVRLFLAREGMVNHALTVSERLCGLARNLQAVVA